MGLQYTLRKDKNSMYYDFIDAYWAISNVVYGVDSISFRLKAYPTRESKLMDLQTLENPSIGYGSGGVVVDSSIYVWNVNMPITNVFPDGSIPAGKDAQYTAIYNWIKDYTKIPFDDILED